MKAFQRHAASEDTYSEVALHAHFAHPLKQTEHAPYHRMRSHSGYTIDILIAALEKALGVRITRLLLVTDADSVAHVTGEILSMWHTDPSIDLQLSLMVNILKEIAHQRAEHYAEQSQVASDLIRRCTLDAEFKREVVEELLTKKALMTSKIIPMP